MSALVVSGSAQFAAVGLLAQGAGAWTILLTTTFLAVRHVGYAAAMREYLDRRGAISRALIAWGLTDETFSVAVHHFQRAGHADWRAYAAACLAVPGVWIAASAVGCLIPVTTSAMTAWGLDAVYPTAIGSLAVLLASQASLRIPAAAAAVAAGAAMAVTGSDTAVIVAAVVGLAFTLRGPAREVSSDAL
jgi:predicted branched-subunit amino acid permease